MRKLLYILTILAIQALFSNGLKIYAADLVISEVMASNNTVIYDQYYYNFGDWIEIYNSSGSSRNLEGYYLTDDPNNLLKYQINYHFNINPGSQKIIWADRYDSYLHTNFSIDSDGEFIALVDPAGNIVDSVTIGRQFPDISYGRNNNNEPTWHYFEHPSPGINNGSGLELPDFSADVIFSLDPGFYPGSISIELSTDTPVDVIRYTLDGSFPTQYSSLYSGAINITSNVNVRARSYTNLKLPAPIKSNSYFINEDSLTLPAISISTWESYLYDDMIGIYVEGKNGKIDNCIDSAVNFNQDWERPVNLEYFLPSGEQVINQVVGVKINGGCSRNVDLKSLAVYAREKYGKSRMEYPLFNNKDIPEYKNVILRNAGNDYYYTYMRDGFMQSLIADVTDIEYQSYQAVRIYMNGDYWGILNMREKMNEHYLAANNEVDPDSVDLIESNSIVIEGSDEHYLDMMNYLRSNDITQTDSYEHMDSLMDINQFIDYYIAQIYYENEDWPNHNIKCWRPQTDEGKWRWLLYDTDYGFGRWPKSGNTVHWAFMKNWLPTELGSTLGDNPAFRNEFSQRFAARLSTTFTSERVLNILDSLVNNIDTEMHLHIAKWGSPWAHYHWKENIQVMEEFAIGRGALLYEQINTEFQLEGTISLELKSDNTRRGQLKLHDILLDSATTATLFKNIPIRIQAVPISGFQFSHWSGSSTSNDPAITISLSEDDSLIAHFIRAKPIRDLFINELSSYSENGLPDEAGETEDWIELFNGSSDPLVLDGLFLTDSLEDPFKHQISGEKSSLIIQPGEYLILYADSDPDQGNLHLNFKLSNKGETIALIQKIGNRYRIIDSLSFKKQFAGTSFGRSPQIPDQFQYLIPTPGAFNEEKLIENVLINEFMAAAQSEISDNKGEYDDWIELYNSGDDTVSVSGIFMTDSLADKERYHIPFTSTDSLTINPGEFLLLWADNQPEQGIRHLGFRLSGQGESIGLVQANGIDFIDSLTFEDIEQDVAIGCMPDGSEHMQFLSPSPGEANHVDTIKNLFINEYMSSNTYSLTDEFGEYDDWIEIYNANAFAVNIAGLYITDSLNNSSKNKLPKDSAALTTIPALGHIVLWADNQPEQGVLHLNFRLSSKGEQIGLYLEDAITPIDSLSYSDNIQDAPLGRLPDGSMNFEYMLATPGATNTRNNLENVIISELSASTNSNILDEYGEANDWIEIYNNNDYAVNIAGVFFTDSLNLPGKFRIPSRSPDSTNIPPQERLILWADNQAEQGVLHLDFALSGKGEELALVNTNGKQILDSITFPNQYANFSYGRKSDTLSWQLMRPTPGEPNIVDIFAGLFINEFMPSNDSWISDEYEEYDDWIELYNDRDEAIDIGGLFLSDSLADKTKSRISSLHPDSTTILPKGFMLLWADNDEEQGIHHLGFKLSKKGEEIALYNYDGSIIDYINYFSTLAPSYGRKTDGAMKWKWFNYPTPKASNGFIPPQEEEPNDLSLLVYPNPMNSYIRFIFTAPKPRIVTLTIYSISGEKVYTQRFSSESDQVEIEWNGTVSNGSNALPGMYIYNIISGDQMIKGYFSKW